jgi:hypothetical protein
MYGGESGGLASGIIKKVVNVEGVSKAEDAKDYGHEENEHKGKLH